MFQQRYSRDFSTASCKIKDAICSRIQPAESSLLWEPNFMGDFLKEPKYVLTFFGFWSFRVTSFADKNYHHFAFLACCLVIR